ncbi:MAG: hypothetical protein ACFFC3_06770 [Candidatus Odinarchaeota archaeon]
MLKKRNIKYSLGKLFARDVDLENITLLYLFFSFLSISFTVEYFILKFFIQMEVGLEIEIPVIMTLFIISILFLASGFFIDIISNKTRFFNIVLLICIIGLLLTTFTDPLFDIIGLLIILITIPQLIIIWCSTLAHETNILNRGRITAIILISSYLLGLFVIFFLFFKDLYIYLIILEFILLIIIVIISRFYCYIETKDRLKSDRKYFKIILELHFSRYSVGLAFLSGLLGGLLNDSLSHFKNYNINPLTFSITSFFYVLAAGWFFDYMGRKNTLVLGILIVSFFYISFGSFYIGSPNDPVFGMPKEIHISLHYAFAILPLILAIIIIAGDFSTERGNLKYRGSINGLFLALMFFGLGLGYLLYKMIDVLYNNFEDMQIWVPNLPNLLNSFALVIVLVWMMAGKDILVSKEKDWAKSLKNLFVLSNSGVCLYNYDFIFKSEHYEEKKEEKECEFDEDLVSGALSGVITIISEITRSSKHIKKIDKEGNHLYFAFGKYHIAVLITSMDLPILNKKLDAFSRAFEQNFSEEIKNFRGNVQVFSPARYMIDRYFSQKYV